MKTNLLKLFRTKFRFEYNKWYAYINIIDLKSGKEKFIRFPYAEKYATYWAIKYMVCQCFPFYKSFFINEHLACKKRISGKIIKLLSWAKSIKELLVVISLVLLLIIFGYRYDKNIKKENINKLDTLLRAQMEYAYFEGQKDAIKGDIRISYDTINNTYIWIKSPWEDKTNPIYNPNLNNK